MADVTDDEDEVAEVEVLLVESMIAAIPTSSTTADCPKGSTVNDVDTRTDGSDDVPVTAIEPLRISGGAFVRPDRSDNAALAGPRSRSSRRDELPMSGSRPTAEGVRGFGIGADKVDEAEEERRRSSSIAELQYDISC